MRLGIMQPYFLPGLGYFDLILRTDRWIVFDTPAYRRHSWMNRNRVLHPSEGWQYITARLQKPSRGTPIREVRLADDDWRDGLLRQLEHYRKHAPHFEAVCGWLQRGLHAEATSLARLNVALLSEACAQLDVPFHPEYFSEMDVDLGPVEGPGDWALRITEALGGDVYINPPGGRAIFDVDRYAAAGIDLRIREFSDLTYSTRGREFLPGLSIVDVLMWNEPQEVRAHLDRDDVGVEGPP